MSTVICAEAKALNMSESDICVVKLQRVDIVTFPRQSLGYVCQGVNDRSFAEKCDAEDEFKEVASDSKFLLKQLAACSYFTACSY